MISRTYRGGARSNCVGCDIGFVTSIQNPAHHLIHDSHDFTINGGYFDGSFTEGGDVGVVDSGGDPTIFGTVFNNFTIINIPNMTVYRSGAYPGRFGIYIDNTGCGVAVNNSVFTQCNSSIGSCIYIHGGQACTVDGVYTFGCVSEPVTIAGTGSTPWTLPTGYAILFVQAANIVDPRYQTKYGPAWNELISTDGGLGAPRNNSVFNVFPYYDSTGQTDLNTLGLGVPVSQPQGAVSPGSVPEPPIPSYAVPT